VRSLRTRRSRRATSAAACAQRTACARRDAVPGKDVFRCVCRAAVLMSIALIPLMIAFILLYPQDLQFSFCSKTVGVRLRAARPAADHRGTQSHLAARAPCVSDTVGRRTWAADRVADSGRRYPHGRQVPPPPPPPYSRVVRPTVALAACTTRTGTTSPLTQRQRPCTTATRRWAGATSTTAPL
jgi:hypothetical protein